MSAADRLIVALDVPTQKEAEEFTQKLGSLVHWYKIGLELYCAEGPALVASYVDSGADVFIDLKLHDIPATVRRTTRQLATLGAGLLTVHAAGGRAMMEAAVEAAQRRTGPRMRILAVTVLTSLDQADLSSVGAGMPLAELVSQRAQLAVEAGCDGVVASSHEAAILRAVVPNDFLIVTPGVRLAGTAVGDQKRVMTPAAARKAGADMVVVGRALRDAANPVDTAVAILKQLES